MNRYVIFNSYMAAVVFFLFVELKFIARIREGTGSYKLNILLLAICLAITIVVIFGLIRFIMQWRR